MRKNDVPNQIDELLLNVLEGDFFRYHQIPAKLIPVLPKKPLKSDFRNGLPVQNRH